MSMALLLLKGLCEIRGCPQCGTMRCWSPSKQLSPQGQKTPRLLKTAALLWKDWPSPPDTWQSSRLERQHLQCCCHLLPAGWPQSTLCGSSLSSAPALFKCSQQGQRRWKEMTALLVLLHNSIYSSLLSSLRACKILCCKGVPYSFFFFLKWEWNDE